jgi:hypothetical protein
MPRHSLAKLPLLLAAMFVGCASANDADEEDSTSGTPVATTGLSVPSRPSGTGNSRESSAPATGSAASTDASSSVGQASANGGASGVAAGGRPSDVPRGDGDAQSSGNRAGAAGTPATGGSSSTSPPSELPDDDPVPSFAADILPILTTNCGSCHAAGFLPRFAASDADAAYAVAVSLSDAMVTRLDAGTMPPSCSRKEPGANGCISVADFDAIERWVQGGTPD